MIALFSFARLGLHSCSLPLLTRLPHLPLWATPSLLLVSLLRFCLTSSSLLIDFITKCNPVALANTSLFIVFQIVTIFGFPYSQSYSTTYQRVWSIFPPNLLAAGLNLLSGATATPQDPGLSWKGRTRCAPNDTECVITVVRRLS